MPVEISKNAATAKEQLLGAAKTNEWEVDTRGTKFLHVKTRHFQINFMYTDSFVSMSMITDPIKRTFELRATDSGSVRHENHSIREPDSAKVTLAEAFLESLPSLVSGAQPVQMNVMTRNIPLSALEEFLEKIVVLEKFDCTQLAGRIRALAHEQVQELFQKSEQPTNPALESQQ